MIRIVYEGGEGEIEEKKSRFIATVRPVRTEQEALDFIASMKKKYWDARHNCFAYIIGADGRLQRCSDDGEPQGTAGRPMLEVLLGEKLTDTAVVVTRYFGGTLLGTGGLMRAYRGAVSAGLAGSRILVRREGIRLGIRTDYNDLGKLQYLMGQRGLTILDSQYAEDVRLYVLVPQEDAPQTEAAVTEATGARAEIFSREALVYGDGERTPVIL